MRGAAIGWCLAVLCVRLGAADAVPRLEPGFHTGTITSVAMDSAERFLVTAAEDQTVRVWDMASVRGEQLRQLVVLRLPAGGAAEGRMYCAAIAPDGSIIAAAGAHSRSIYLFNRESGKLLRRIAVPDVALHLEYSPDGRYLAAALNESAGVRLYRTADWAGAGEDASNQGATYWAAFSPQFARDDLLATAAEDGYVRLYAVRGGRLQLLRRAKAESKDPPVSVVFSPDGRKLAVSLSYPNGYPMVEVWNPSTLARLYRAVPLNAMGGTAESLAWSGDGKYLYLAGDLAAGSPNSLIVRVGRGGQDEDFQSVRALGDDGQCYITGLAPLRDGRLVFISADRGGIGLLNAEWKLERFHAAPLPVYIGLEDYGRFLVSQDGTAVRFAYAQDGAEPAWLSVPKRSIVPDAPAAGFAGSPPDDQSIDLRGLGTDQVLLKGKPLDVDGETALRVAVVKGSGWFLIGTQWGLCLFNGEGKRQWKIELEASPEALNVSADGRFAVAALSDGTLRWFRMTEGVERLAWFPHPDGKRWVAWTPEGYYDCSAGGEELLGFLTDRGESQPPDFQPAASLRSKYYRPEAVERALAAQ